MHDKRFLALQGKLSKVRGFEGFFEVVPANMVGDVDGAGGVQDIGQLFVTKVAAGAALGRVFREGVPGFSVVEGDEGSGPGLLQDVAGERQGSGGKVGGIAFGKFRGKRFYIEGGFVADLGTRCPGESLVLQLDAEFCPLKAVEADLAERLGVEELVGEYDGLLGDFDVLAVSDCGDRLEWAWLGWIEEGSARFGSELDPMGLGGGEARLLEQGAGGFDYDFGEGLPEANGGVKVGVRIFADTLLFFAVVAQLGVVEGGFYEVGEFDESVRARFGSEGGSHFGRLFWQIAHR